MVSSVELSQEETFLTLLGKFQGALVDGSKVSQVTYSSVTEFCRLGDLKTEVNYTQFWAYGSSRVKAHLQLLEDTSY